MLQGLCSLRLHCKRKACFFPRWFGGFLNTLHCNVGVVSGLFCTERRGLRNAWRGVVENDQPTCGVNENKIHF